MKKTAKPIRIALSIFSLTALGSVAGCLTLNVNVKLPEAAVQSATDDYVRELYRAKKKETTPEATEPSGAPTPAPAKKVSLAFGIAEAHAESPFKVTSAGALRIREKLAAQLDEVLAQKRAGVLGESNEGKLVLKSAEALKPLLRKRVQKLVEDENATRGDLYAEVLSSNGLGSDRLKLIQQSFARSFQAESPSGTWVQDAEGRWSQKP